MSEEITKFPFVENIELEENPTGFAKAYVGDLYSSEGRFGNGDDFPTFQKAIQEYDSDEIYLFGGLSGEKKWNILSRSKVFLLTSHHESYGNVIIEAMSMGLPVVAYNQPHYQELFSEGGIITVPIGDKEKAATELLRLLVLSDYLPDYLYNTSLRAHKFGIQKSWTKHAEEFQRLIRYTETIYDKKYSDFIDSTRCD